jgi:MFS family permease
MPTVTVANAPPRAGRREWTGLAVLALPTLLVSLDTFVMLLAVPHLSADLQAGSTQQLWILDIYGFMVAGFLITMGTLGDRKTVGQRLPEQSQQATLRSLGDDALRGVARRYITAWERNGQRRQAGRARTCRYHRQAIRR